METTDTRFKCLQLNSRRHETLSDKTGKTDVSEFRPVRYELHRETISCHRVDVRLRYRTCSAVTASSIAACCRCGRRPSNSLCGSHWIRCDTDISWIFLLLKLLPRLHSVYWFRNRYRKKWKEQNIKEMKYKKYTKKANLRHGSWSYNRPFPAMAKILSKIHISGSWSGSAPKSNGLLLVRHPVLRKFISICCQLLELSAKSVQLTLSRYGKKTFKNPISVSISAII